MAGSQCCFHKHIVVNSFENVLWYILPMLAKGLISPSSLWPIHKRLTAEHIPLDGSKLFRQDLDYNLQSYSSSDSGQSHVSANPRNCFYKTQIYINVSNLILNNLFNCISLFSKADPFIVVGILHQYNFIIQCV